MGKTLIRLSESTKATPGRLFFLHHDESGGR